MDWFFVFNGRVQMRSPDDVPDTFTHPTRGIITNVRALADPERADLGWLQAAPLEARPEFNPRTQKVTIVPTPLGLDAWIQYRKDLAAAPLVDAGKTDVAIVPAELRAAPLPVIAQAWVLEALSSDEAKEAKNHAFAQIRWKRLSGLQATDHLMLADAPIDEATRAQWVAYRKSLRDLPQQFDDPRDVVWPAPPGEPDLGL